MICGYRIHFGEQRNGCFNLWVGLWFVNHIQRSLINPNQFRSYGISVCNYPTGGNQYLVIDMEEYFVPIGMKVTTCTFTTRYHTDEEFQQFYQILLSNQYHWDPSAKIFHISVMQEQIRYSVVRVSTPSRHIIFVHFNSNSFFITAADT